ncbi:hypothetical protein [Nocardioides sp. SYSU DS0663]|uniref:hypothetical protein n=1 Tax=Nocardioides sp. SYSU DS0663 TaxID=3416445 RepID=UPI003F4C5D81
MPATTTASERRHRAGLLDIRNIIGLLLVAYGVILTLMGLFGDNTTSTGETDANLWAGLVMLAAGLTFLAWARLRPILVPEGGVDEDPATGDEDGIEPGAHERDHQPPSGH